MITHIQSRTAGTDATHIFVFIAALIGALAIAREGWAALLVIAALPLVLMFPVQLSLGVFAFLVPFESALVISDSGSTLTFFIGAAAAAILALTALVQGRLQIPPRAALWWTLLVIWSLISVGWALDTSTALHRLPTVGSLLLLYLVAVSFRMTRTELYWVASMTILGGVAAALYVMPRGFSTLVARVSVADVGPNLFAATLLLPAMLSIGMIFGARRRILRVGAIIALLVVSTAIFLSMSRGGLVALAAGILVFIIRYRNWRLLVVLALIFIPLLAMPDLFFHRLEQGLYNRGTGRFDIWHVGFRIFSEHPILGVGLDNFKIAYAQHSGEAPFFRGYVKVAHNVLLQVLAEMGVFGFIFFVGGCVSSLQGVWHAIHRRVMPNTVLISYEASCYAMLVMALSLDIMWRKVFWLSWILLVIAGRVLADSQPLDQRYECADPSLAPVCQR